MCAALTTQNPFTAPVVDQLSVRVVVDSHYERFLPKATHQCCTIEHIRRIPGRQMTTLAGEWGLSLHLDSMAGGAHAQYMLDFGYTPEIISRNFDLLGIDPAKLNGLILSHAHRDHYGGLEGFVRTFRHQMPDDMNFYVGGEGIFRERFVREGDGEESISWGSVNRTALTAQNVQPVACETPHDLGGAFTSGYIERDSFEEVTGGSMVVADDHYTDAEKRGQLVKDIHPEEHATCYVVRGRGLVVISSCGHTGIINTVRTAMKVTNTDKLHAVIGGFHLGMAPQDYIEHTVDEFEKLDPDVVLPMHCSGVPFIDAMKRRLPHKVVGSNLGSRFTFGV